LKDVVLERLAASLPLSQGAHTGRWGQPWARACSAPLVCASQLLRSERLSARRRRRATAASVLATPCELGHRPLLQQAMVASMISSIAIIGQRSRRRWRPWRRCRWATLALSVAAERLLALRPALQPIRIARSAIVLAFSSRGRRRRGRRRGGRRWRRRRRCGRATDVMVNTAPSFLAHAPSLYGANSAVWFRRWGGRRRMGSRSCRATHTIMLTAPRLLVQGPQAIALAAIWFACRGGKGGGFYVRFRCGGKDYGDCSR